MVTPRRIASLLASGTEILCALGLADRVVAISHECDYPASIATRPRVTFAHVDAAAPSQVIDDQVQQLVAQGAALYKIDEELLVELAPDLIVTQKQCDVCAVKYDDVIHLIDTREMLRDTAVVALNPVSLDDIFADIQNVGAATGTTDAATQYVSSLRQRVATIEQRTAHLTLQQRPRVVCIEWIQPLMLAANWMPRLVQLAGGQNGLTEGDRHSTYGQWSDVVAYDPQVIVIMPCGFDLNRTIQESKVLPAFDRWNSLSAVKSNQVYAVDASAYFNRSGPRILDSLEVLAHLLHPEITDAPVWIDQPQRPWCRLRTVGRSLVPLTPR